MNAMDALERARAAWARSQPQYAFDLYPDPVLNNGHPDPPLSRTGVAVVEDAEPQPCRSPDGVRAYASLTAASAARTGLLGGTVAGASASSLTNQGEAPDDLA